MLNGQSPQAHGPICIALCDSIVHCQTGTAGVFSLCDGIAHCPSQPVSHCGKVVCLVVLF